ncbi:MAG TPA: biotin/lipoate A/B protein ligase family protein [Chroococcidiopsis sp.]
MVESNWRLIPPIVASGRMQMAIDRWLFEQHSEGVHPPTLRFYTWLPVAISLGYHQRRYPDHWRSLTWQGAPIDIVRRPSGGRAVLHQGDLTYAVITSGAMGNRLQTYEAICQFLIDGWRSLHVSLAFGQSQRSYIHNPNCFGTATGADLVLANGSKLIGSAQVWRGQTVLQHGSIRLEPDLGLFEQVFGASDGSNLRAELPERWLAEAASKGRTERLAHLATLRSPESQDGMLDVVLMPFLIEALTMAAQTRFGISLIEQPLSDREWQAIEAIAAKLDRLWADPAVSQ